VEKVIFDYKSGQKTAKAFFLLENAPFCAELGSKNGQAFFLFWRTHFYSDFSQICRF